ncbi:P-loop containing nucleoside triphosphate hydrolase protein [Cokeromyces recurvatus]|uniref:P-loop containing nucleoside triphosphate hydrolase protein n=1 Tax=Cokeromyces recurvatus TaxID=90255 RepID=UPI00222072C5|nr:P-loop containing nucleoside triphosphate hydrolase protein [Cokeromyces recurvatus]KAI7907846.1 P-loop containing nucleoside triphosphate hydrolase protein [Cokeromyces recurvatus]
MTASNLELLQVYSKGLVVWLPDEEQGWISATVISIENDNTIIKMSLQDDMNPEKVHIFEASLVDIESNKISLPPFRNPPKMENTEDLTSLSYLNEPSVLNTIKIRYEEKNIYTYSGIVLIATNPFAHVPLYGPEIIQKYSGNRRNKLEPHLFAIAEDAYRCMIRDNKNQTIIVSGESGAGKTVSAKYIMRYFATADDQEMDNKGIESMTEVEEQILATNPIMEAFGNAKTTRNDNSSRFGKYIEIHFDKERTIIGAKIRTYLLERSRLIFQPETERNYHIFYQLCAGANENEKKELALKEWSYFHYLNQSGTGVIPSVDDAKDFQETRAALTTIGIHEELQSEIFHLLAALLHLGNIEIGGRNETAVLDDQQESLALATELLGLDATEFKKWIVRKQIVTRSEKIITNLSPLQAQVVRDSVAKYIYAHLFDWLVDHINNSLSCSDPEEQVASFIGVLDIYGFEHFQKNSFEQFCINYANEKLQQQFNQHVFKLEQEEYIKEDIDWKFISFSDNQKCIELIESKMGILSLLDEESRLPSGTDQGFCNKLYQQFGSNCPDYFKKPRFSNNAFVVSHYAHDVQYESEGFLDKNKDTVPEELLALLHASQSTFLADMIQPVAPVNLITDQVPKKTLSQSKKPTLGSMFRLSLINLMDTIGETNVHYIRCIKPNEAKIAWAFEPNIVLSQLRACGVLETIRISCAGYPTKWTYEDFVERYHALVDFSQMDNTNKDAKMICSHIINNIIQDTDKYQMGLTKIFFRAGQLAYIEKLRSDKLYTCAVMIQKNVRRFLARLQYKRALQTIVKLQAITRRQIAVRALEHMRREKAATVIQSNWRRYYARKQFLKTKAFIIQLQTVIRGDLAKKRYNMLRREHAAIMVQKIVRGWLSRKRYQKIRNYVIQLQTAIRCFQARHQLIVLRAEARSVNHLKEASHKLESRVIDLIQNLTQQREEKSRLKLKAIELENQVRSWIQKYERLDQRAKDLEQQYGKNFTITNTMNLNEQRDALQAEYITSLNKIKLQDKELLRLKEELLQQRDGMSRLRMSRLSTSSDKTLDITELKNQISALKAATECKLYVQ